MARKCIGICIAIVKEASKVMKDNMSMLAFPIVPVIFLFVLFFCLLTTCGLLITSPAGRLSLGGSSDVNVTNSSDPSGNSTMMDRVTSIDFGELADQYDV